jgi:hypothetical protein
MRLPTFRVRTLMIAVAACAVCLGFLSVQRRRAQFMELSQDHLIAGAEALFENWSARSQTPSYSAQVRYHWALAARYEEAASHPWLPVEPDPPPPN